jgi:hypothetical protein
MSLPVIIFFLCGVVCSSQGPNPGVHERDVSPVVSPALKLFLGLTDAQVKLIGEKNLEFERFRAGKHARRDQVRAEIAAETRQAALDPMALGLRYVELEQIRREIRAAEERLREELRSALTAQQLGKLTALEQAGDLLPVWRQAAALHLVATSPTPPPAGPSPAPSADGQGVEERITDSRGRPIAGALVVPKSPDEPSPPIPEIAIVSDEEGRYAWRLPPGRYQISVSAAGYRETAREAVVRAGEVTRLDFVLERI